jgi:hypothetical protein
MEQDCLCCDKNKELVPGTLYCKECYTYYMQALEEKNTYLTSKSRRDSTGQVYFDSGFAWITSPSGRTLCLGEEKRVTEILKTNIIPDDLPQEKAGEFMRIFVLQKEPINKDPKKIHKKRKKDKKKR